MKQRPPNMVQNKAGFMVYLEGRATSHHSGVSLACLSKWNWKNLAMTKRKMCTNKASFWAWVSYQEVLVSNKARIGCLSFQWVCSHSVSGLIPQSLPRFLLDTQERKGKKNSLEPEAKKETLESELGLGWSYEALRMWFLDIS